MNTDLQARPSARVVLVNWKNAPLTLRAARSIVPQLRAGDRLVIVDNGSEDDSLAVLDAHLPELLTGLRRSESGDGAATDIPIELVNAGVNGGFGAGVTAGAAGLSEDALVLLNNDATVREGFLDALLAPLGTPDVGATTALILLAGRYRHAREDEAQALSGNGPTRWVRQTDEETMQSEGTVLVNSTGNIVDRAGNGQDRDWLCEAKDLDAAPDVFGLCGGACAIRRDAWEKVGGIRTDLFMYYEDTDLSYRLREAGYRVRFVREAVVDHEHAASSDATSPMFTRVNARNRLIVAVEHAPWPVVARALVRSLARAVRAGCRGPVAHGVAQGLASFPAALRARRTRKARRDGTPRRGDATTKKTLESE
ncbi:glycosyltransferase family 2 protein [Actinomyces bouchesdurhonensis]|jgi:hypothetical protein|uniref:glycosyltransferase family 2 protein n=1 Tax=Actinomyces bouchesdurhonensis TaxID=1852361 RepID=UPI003AF10AFF